MSDAPGVPDASSDGGSVLDGASEALTTDAGGDGCTDAGTLPSTLACTGLYADFATKTVAANALPYTPATPLWSDGATKQRWIELPANAQIDISNPNEWTFPVGTKLFKEFRVGGKRVETRMFQKTAASFWVYATYAWNGDDSEATINFGGPITVGDADSGVDGGTVWTIPTNDECDECHRGRLDRILGFEQVGLGLPAAQGLTLAALTEQGLVTPTPTQVSLTIGDDGTGLDSLALGWLHVNCGVTCHNSNASAEGYGAGMLLRLDPTQLDGGPPDPSTWDILSTTLNVACVSGSFIGEPRIRPGDPGVSVLAQLITERGAVQMPPIGSQVVDVPDTAVVGAWIEALGAQGKDGGSGPASVGGPDGGLPDTGVTEGFPDAAAFHQHDASAPDAPSLEDAEAPVPDATIPDGTVFTVPDATLDSSPFERDAGAPPSEPADAAADRSTVDAAAALDDTGPNSDDAETGQSDP
jgi:hypothetical protein